MKREIKFRAWHKDTKAMLNIWTYEWIKGYFAGTDKPNESFYNEFELAPDGNSCNRVTGKSVFMTFDGQIIGVLPIDDKTTQSVNYTDEYELMQFTGLKDKNDKEIYEGDILKLQYPINYGFGGVHNEEIIVTILFESGCFWFSGGGYTDCNWHFYNEYEVIGNIYEHSNLLDNGEQQK